MLTLTKRQHLVGFSAMNADELFFINGGSGSGYNCYMGRNSAPALSKGERITSIKPSSTNQQKENSYKQNQYACAVAVFGCTVGAIIVPPAAPGLGIVVAGIGLAAASEALREK